jgi:hypothetical protein
MVAFKRNVQCLSPNLNRRWGYDPANPRYRVINKALVKFVSHLWACRVFHPEPECEVRLVWV